MSFQAEKQREKGGGSQWPAVLLVVGAGIVSAFQVGKAPMALAAIQSDLGLGLAVAALLISCFALVGAVAGAPIGLAVDRIGAERMIASGLLLQAAGSAIGGMSPGASLLLTMRALEGLGFLGVIVAAPPLIYALAPKRKLDRAMAIWATFMPVGMTVIMLASPLLGLLQWRGFWLLNAAILLAYAALFAATLGLSRTTRSPDREIGADLKRAMSTPGPWALAGLFAAFSAAYFSVFSFLPILLSERFGIDAHMSNIMVGIAIAASGAGNILCGQFLARGTRPGRIIIVSFVIMGVAGIGILAVDVAMAIAYGLSIALSFASGFIPVVVFHEAPKRTSDPSLVGVTVGMAMQGNNIGLLVGPALAGGLASIFGWPAVAAWVASICIAAVLLARSLFRSHEPAAEPRRAA